MARWDELIGWLDGMECRTMQRIGKSGGVQGINEQTSQARSLLSRR
jgi:hypothetical protein